MQDIHDESPPDPLLEESLPDSLLDESPSDPLLDESFVTPSSSLYQKTDIYEQIARQAQWQADLINASVAGSIQSLHQSIGSIASKSMFSLLGDYSQSIGSIASKSMVGLLGDYSQSIGSIASKSMVGLLGDYEPIGSIVSKSMVGLLGDYESIGSVVSKPMVGLLGDYESIGSVVSKPMVGLLGDYSRSVESIADSLQYFNSSFNFASILGTYSSDLNAYVSSLPSLIIPSFQRFGERVRHWILAAFEHAGLCLAPSMSEDLMHQIAAWSLKGDLRPVTLLVWNYYSRNNHARLRNAVYGWRDTPEFCARWRFYEEAFKAHVQRLYSSSIRGLIPEIEGIAGRFVYVNGIKVSPNRSGLDLKKTASVVDRMLNVAADIANLDTQATDMEHWIRVKSLKQYLENIFYENLAFEQNFDEVRNRRKLSRHGSSHGIQIGSIMAMNSLRLFLLLDTIHYILQAYITKGGLI
jgi:hypothetical protein